MFACCDESGIDGESSWIVLGALWVPDEDHLHDFEAAALRMRLRKSFWGEFKWQKVGERKLPVYRELLDLALALPDLRFTSMVIERAQVTREDLENYHEGERSRLYLKCFRKLLKRRMIRWAEQGHREFTLLWDKQSVNRKLAQDFKKFLNQDMDKLDACTFKHLSPINSASLHFAQVADLLTGATRYAWEGPEATSATEEARQALRARIEAWTGESLTNENQWSANNYSLWNWDKTKSPAAKAGLSAESSVS